MFTISFDYNGKVYNALVREKDPENKQYRITIMNGDLEKRLHGNNVITVNNMQSPESEIPPEEKDNLLSQIRNALIKHLYATAVT